MTRVEDFGNHLFSGLYYHYETIKETPDFSAEKPDTSKKDLGSETGNFEDLDSKNILISVYMLSYVYGFAFRQRFCEVGTILMQAEENSPIYIRCFAEVLHEKYSPLKFLIVCSFISQLFLFYEIDDLVLRRKYYVQRTTEALTDVFHNIFEKDFPQNRWTDIRNKASEIAGGYPCLRPFIYLENKRLSALEAALVMTIMYNDKRKSQPVDTVLIPSVNTPDVPSSQIMANVPITEVPVISPDGLPINRTVYPLGSENLLCPQAHSFSFGTVGEDPELSHLLQFSGYRTEAVKFENVPSRTDLHLNQDSQEELAVRSFEDGPETSSRTVRPTENGASEHCAEDNSITSDEDFFLIYSSSSGSEDESRPFSQANKIMGKKSERSAIISVQEPMDAGKHDPDSATLSAESDPESSIISNEDSYGGSLNESVTLTSEENVNNPESGDNFGRRDYGKWKCCKRFRKPV